MGVDASDPDTWRLRRPEPRFRGFFCFCCRPGSSRAALEEFLGVADGPALLHFRTLRGVPEGLPRPDVRPREVKQRLMRHIGAEAPWRDH